MLFGLRNAAIYVTYSFNKLTQWTETKFFLENYYKQKLWDQHDLRLRKRGKGGK